MDQMSRTATLDAFREGRIMLLAASDVAARGLDIPDVSHIFNFDVPWQADDYVHRIGRTGRAGKEGRSLTIVTVEDIKQLKDIEKMLGASVAWIGDPPSEQDMAEGSRKRRGRGAPARRAGAGRDGSRRGSEAAPRPASGRGVRRPERAPRPDRGSDRGADRVPERRKAAAPAGADAGGAERLREEQAAPAPVAKSTRPEAGKPPRQRPERQRPERQRPERQRAERKPPRQPWEPRDPRRDREDRTPTPVGLGDHVPAFLRRPARPSSH
jgi:superfamily II DNA/RNA helicase